MMKNKKQLISQIREVLVENNIEYEVLDSGSDSLKLEDQIEALDMMFREGLGTLLYKSSDGRYIGF